jgi:glycosyltransferase involved in cell wall biosynthesis
MTLVSVIVPVWNGARYLDAALASVFGQDHRPIEVHVVDDGSTDDTPAVAARWPEARYLRIPHGGVARARNAGLLRATGDLVALLDADDVWAGHKLRVQLEHLDAHPEHGCVIAEYRNFLEPGTPRPAWLSARDLAETHVGGIGNLVLRRAVLERLGGFDPDDPSDLDFSLRAQAAGVVVGVVPEVLLHRRIHDRNQSATTDGAALRLRLLRAAIARRRSAP